MRFASVSAGSYVIATAALHQLVGLLAGFGLIDAPGASGRKPLLEIARAGVVGAVEPDLARQSCVWFLLFGGVLWMLGTLMRDYERVAQALPRALGAQLLLLGGLGVLLLPVSGFWLCIPQGLAVLLARAPDHAPAR